jgi:cytoskeletal protein RodZ
MGRRSASNRHWVLKGWVLFLVVVLAAGLSSCSRNNASEPPVTESAPETGSADTTAMVNPPSAVEMPLPDTDKPRGTTATAENQPQEPEATPTPQPETEPPATPPDSLSLPNVDHPSTAPPKSTAGGKTRTVKTTAAAGALIARPVPANRDSLTLPDVDQPAPLPPRTVKRDTTRRRAVVGTHGGR